MVTWYSRWASAVCVPTRRAEDLDAGWWAHIHGCWCRGSWSGIARRRRALARRSPAADQEVSWLSRCPWRQGDHAAGTSKAAFIVLAGYGCTLINYMVVNVYFVGMHSPSGM